MDYKYSLARRSKKGTCPYCNRPKCFTLYIDNVTGEILDPMVGRCDHENSCPQKHYSPADFFRDNPQARDKAWREKHRSEKVAVAPVSPLPADFTQTVFFDLAWAEGAARRGSTFATWFRSLPFDGQRIEEVLREYYVGGTARDVFAAGAYRGPAVVFWMIDQQQRVHDAKLMAYTCDGHRVQGWGDSMRSICQKTGQGPQLEQTEKVLFGLHLTTRYPDKVVCVVESEKTALVCACRYPQFVWVATGGCGNLQVSKLRPLMHRRLVIYPDSGEYQKWKDCMRQSGHKNYSIVDHLEQYAPNTDIADIILGVARLKGETQPATPSAPVAQPAAPSAPVAQPAVPSAPVVQPRQESPEYDRIWKEAKSGSPALTLLADKLQLQLQEVKDGCPF